MSNDRSNFFFNVLALENILVALTREIGDGPCFLYIKFSWIGVDLLCKLHATAQIKFLCLPKFLQLRDLEAKLG